MDHVKQENSWPRLTGSSYIAQNDITLNIAQTLWSWFSNTGRGFVITQGDTENNVIFTVETSSFGRHRTLFDKEGQSLLELDRHRTSIKNAWVARRPRVHIRETDADTNGKAKTMQTTVSDSGGEGNDEIVMTVAYNVWTHIHITMDASFPAYSVASKQQHLLPRRQDKYPQTQGDLNPPIPTTTANDTGPEVVTTTRNRDIRIRCKDWWGVKYEVTCGDDDDDVMMTANCQTDMPGWLSGYKMTPPKFTIEVKQGMDLTLAAAFAVCISDSYSELRVFML